MTDFDYNDPTTWEDTSYAGNERDLAYMLDDATMEWFNTMKEYGYTRDDAGIDPTAWHLFNMLLMSKAHFLAHIELDQAEPAEALELWHQIRADAREDSGDFFSTALNTRWAIWITLQDLTAKYRDMANKEN